MYLLRVTFFHDSDPMGGIRMIAGSGYVYRAEVATGKEGAELTVVFDYPW